MIYYFDEGGALMSDLSGTIKRALHVWCKSRIHTSNDDSKGSKRSSHAEFESHEMRMQSGCAVPWAAAREPLDDEQQNQLKSNGPADINSHIDG